MSLMGADMGVELKGLRQLRQLDNAIREEAPEKLAAQLTLLPLNKLQAGSYQPRVKFDASALEELAASIKANGVLQPLIVRKIAPENYEIIAGERRWRAAQLAGLLEVPVIIREIPDQTALAFALIENIQRQSLDPLEEAMALARFRDEFTMTHAQIAAMVGLPRSSVTNLLRILSLPPSVKQWLQEKQLEMGHAKLLLALSEEQQVQVAEGIVEKKLTVRETEHWLSKLKSKEVTLLSSPPIELPAISQFEAQLEKIFQQRVKISVGSRGRLKLSIDLPSIEALSDWVKHLSRIK